MWYVNKYTIEVISIREVQFGLSNVAVPLLRGSEF
jgi:hypothetical protein